MALDEWSELVARSSGILLHVTSLPGGNGVGDLGPEAYHFVDELSSGAQRLWQVLPLVPPGMGESPYAALSAFAGNPLLISLAKLVEEGLLRADEVAKSPAFPPKRVDFAAVRNFKTPLLRRAFERFSEPSNKRHRSEFEAFYQQNAFWLDDFALFMALKNAHKGVSWWEWQSELIAREPSALDRARHTLADEVQFELFLQFAFFSQWHELKRYANERKIGIIGDVPIFVAHDSADVWAHQHLFTVDPRGNPTVVAGVPPDYFSATGQRWGNPHYRWDALALTGYQWWIERMRETFGQVDFVRIDHFRGFEAYWEIPADSPTAERGRWVKGPGEALFRAIENAMGRKLPIIVEDLGIITPEVEALRDRLGYPGMKVLQFAFGGGPTNPYLPQNYRQNCVVYSATHDNDTTVGWYAKLNAEEKAVVRQYTKSDGRDIAWDLVKLAFGSVANTAIVPLQDVLSLGSEARMNMPGRAHGNWAWRLGPNQLTRTHVERLRELTSNSGRAAR